jgi:four helix bundle protein
MKQNDLLDRTFNFGVDVLKFIRQLPKDSEYNLIRFQLGKSATSVGANYEESQAGSSKADFKNKVRIALKEARESNYWLRIIHALSEIESVELNRLLQESKEIKNILAAILNKMN